MGLECAHKLGSLGSGPVRVAVPIRLSNGELAGRVYSSSVVEGGVLLGAMRRLEDTDHDFKFTVKEDFPRSVSMEWLGWRPIEPTGSYCQE
ncbi:hypothetical protein J4Q44_G00120010 [Coregonus suidteri]|uniref:Uncharacterized protein n=1 Tax=Coregonus suidteri TaxID=861788 RepID=A0AAN8M3T1_9TELE